MTRRVWVLTDSSLGALGPESLHRRRCFRERQHFSTTRFRAQRGSSPPCGRLGPFGAAPTEEIGSMQCSPTRA